MCVIRLLAEISTVGAGFCKTYNGAAINRALNSASKTVTQFFTVIGESLSEPHINVLNASSVCMYVCIVLYSYVVP